MIRSILLLLASAAFVLPGSAQQTMTIKVYFHNEKFNPNQQDCTKVFPTTREIPKTKAVARAALDELLKGVTPEEERQQFISYPAEDTKDVIKSLNVKGGVAFVNFKKVVFEKLGNTTSSCGGGFYSTIESTLKQFRTVKRVVYAVEGSTADFYDWVQVGECPFSKSLCAPGNFK